MVPTEVTRPGYAVGFLTDVQVNDELLDYMIGVEETMRAHGGRWLVHGTSAEIREGTTLADVVIIEFDDLDAARGWYASAEYQQIIALRRANAQAWIALLDGVPPGYSTRSTVAALRACLTGE